MRALSAKDVAIPADREGKLHFFVESVPRGAVLSLTGGSTNAWGPPRTVSEFVRNLDLKDVRYTSAVASCGGTAAGALPLVHEVATP